MSFRDEKYDSKLNTYNLTGSSFKRWRAQLAKGLDGTIVTTIACLGDSITEGVQAATPRYLNNWPARLRAALIADGRFGTVGEGASFSTGTFATDYTGYDNRWLISGSGFGANPVTGGLINRSMWQNSTPGSAGTVQFTTPVCDRIVIYYQQHTAAGTWTYDVDGGAPVGVNANGAIQPMQLVVTPGSLAAHVIKFHSCASSGFTMILGVGWYTNAARNNVEVVTGGGCSALKIADIIAGTANVTLGSLAPDLTIVCIGRNNADTALNYKTDVTTLVQYVRNTMSKDILLVTPPPSSHPIPPTDGTANYPANNKIYQQLYEVANENDVAVFDLAAHFTRTWATAPVLLSTDDIHPIPAGDRAIGLAIAQVLAA